MTQFDGSKQICFPECPDSVTGAKRRIVTIRQISGQPADALIVPTILLRMPYRSGNVFAAQSRKL